jgi:HK97 family phage major capsid protein
MAKATVQEQITVWQGKQTAAESRLGDIVSKQFDEGRTAEAEEKEEMATLKSQIAEIKEQIVNLQDYEKLMVAKATPVVQVATPEQAASVRRSEPITVKKNDPKGILVARMAIAMVRAQNNPYLAMELAKTHWKDNPEVSHALNPDVAMRIKTAVEAGDTTTSGWASQLLPAAQQQSGDFLEMLRDAIVIGKLPLRKVPFNVAVPLQSGAGTYRYVGEGAGKPVTKPTYGNATLRFEKAAGIIVITDELARFGSPDAELLVRDEMLKGLTNFFDTIFLGAGAGLANVEPAGILNGKSATAATLTTAAGFRSNFNTMIQITVTNKQDPSKAYIIMSAGIAMALSSMINSLGQPEFSSITATGGNYMGIPIIVSQAAGTNIIVVFPDQILLAEDPGVRIDISREATIEMDTAPTAGESSPITTVESIKSMFQNNMVAIRAEQYRTWKVARSSAVEYISGASYTP